MLFRLVFLGTLVFLFLFPVYRLLKRKTIRLKCELEDDDTNFSDRFSRLKTEEKKLKADCEEEARLAEKKVKASRSIKNKMKG